MDIEGAWASTCKIIFGAQIGDIDDFAPYLQKYVQQPSSKVSAFSGKKVTVAEENFCPQAKFMANEEQPLYEKKLAKMKLDINAIKDFDSILEALDERLYYSGNIVLGKSGSVVDSNRCTNSSNVYKSSDIYESKFIAYCRSVRYSNCTFGSDLAAHDEYAIKMFDCRNVIRSLEACYTFYSSDCFYVGNIEGCSHCMFSFNIKSKNYCIGNLELSKDDYFRLRKSLLEQMGRELESKKSLPGIIDVIGSKREYTKKASGDWHKKPANASAPKEIEQAFASTTAVLLGKKLGGIDNYAAWLTSHVPAMIKDKSALSDEIVYVMALHFSGKMLGSYIKVEEARAHAQKKLTKEEAGALALANASQKLQGIKQISPEIILGRNINLVEAAAYADSAHCYNGSIYSYDKYCAYCFWPRESEYVFGSSQTFLSKFCLKCYNSNNLTRCFEVSDSNACSDCYFCHNSENLDNCMFCFNTKSKRYAIGNVEVGRESYLKVKNIVLEGICKKIEKEKGLGLSIYDLGCAKEAQV